MASVLWELEGELLHIAMKCDKLRKKDGLSPLKTPIGTCFDRGLVIC